MSNKSRFNLCNLFSFTLVKLTKSTWFLNSLNSVSHIKQFPVNANLTTRPLLHMGTLTRNGLNGKDAVLDHDRGKFSIC